MSGFNFDHYSRRKLALAALDYLRRDEIEEYLKNRRPSDDKWADCHRAPLNSFIMEIQEPYIETIRHLTSNLELRQAFARDSEKERNKK